MSPKRSPTIIAYFRVVARIFVVNFRFRFSFFNVNFDPKSLNIPELVTSIWAKIAVVVVILAMLAYLPFWWYFDRTVPFPPHVDTIDVVVPAGANGRQIAELTKEKGIAVDVNMMLAALRMQGDGRYRFTNGMSLAQIVDKYQSGQVESFTMRIAEGATLWQVRSAVAQLPDVVPVTKDMTDEEFLKALNLAEAHGEGLFAPETYRFRSGLTDIDVFRAAYREQQRILREAWEARKPGLKLNNPYEALILASIIEKETSRAEDRALVSSVFNNRLKLKMPLQTDPTIIYGIGKEFNGNLTRKDLRTPGIYNTYLNQGLPPSPISMPSKASIEAALQPADTKYLYFVARGDGTSQFSNHLQEHNRAVQKYQKAPARRANIGK